MRNEPKADPSPKPDHIRALRDLAANFVRAIDRTALEFESVSTSDLSDRVASLVALHELETTEAEKSTLPTEQLRSRVSLIRQVVKGSHDLPYGIRDMSNGELKKRIAYLQQYTEAIKSEKTVLGWLTDLDDELLNDIDAEARAILKARKREARNAAKVTALRDHYAAAREDPADDPVGGVIEDDGPLVGFEDEAAA